jgi:cation transport regulator ChaC
MDSSRVMQLEPGQSVIFGYGSLLSLRSLEMTLRRRCTDQYVRCILRGWRRTWDIAMANKTFFAEVDGQRMYPSAILYLNVRRQIGELLNGVAFAINPEELARFDERESIYERIDITNELTDVRVENGLAYVYAGLPQCEMRQVDSPAVAAVRATYVAIVNQGLEDHGAEFRAAYDASTDPVPQHLIIDDRRD